MTTKLKFSAQTDRTNPDWVVTGGAPGEIAYCTRCGEGLKISLPQRVEIVVACTKAFVDLHKNCQPGNYVPKPAQSPEEWAAGRDCGTSSLTIYHVITGNPSHHRMYDVPHDPDDFGRCYRLLKLFPTWREKLHLVAERFPEWVPMVREWDRMTLLFEEEAPSGRAPKLYDLMKELEAEGYGMRRRV